MLRRELLKGAKGVLGFLPVVGHKRFKLCELHLPGVDTSGDVAILKCPPRFVTAGDLLDHLDDGTAKLTIEFGHDKGQRWTAYGIVSSVNYRMDGGVPMMDYSGNVVPSTLYDPGELDITCHLVHSPQVE